MKHFLTTRTYLEASDSKRNSGNNSHFWLYNGHHHYKTTLMEEKFKKKVSTVQAIILWSHISAKDDLCSFVKIYSLITNHISFEGHEIHFLGYEFKCHLITSHKFSELQFSALLQIMCIVNENYFFTPYFIVYFICISLRRTIFKFTAAFGKSFFWVIISILPISIVGDTTTMQLKKNPTKAFRVHITTM